MPNPDPHAKYINEAVKENVVASASSQAPRPSDFERTWPRPKVACVDCGELMVLRWGEERRPHFAHLDPSGLLRANHPLWVRTLFGVVVETFRSIRCCLFVPRDQRSQVTSPPFSDLGRKKKTSQPIELPDGANTTCMKQTGCPRRNTNCMDQIELPSETQTV